MGDGAEFPCPLTGDGCPDYCRIVCLRLPIPDDDLPEGEPDDRPCD